MHLIKTASALIKDILIVLELQSNSYTHIYSEELNIKNHVSKED